MRIIVIYNTPSKSAQAGPYAATEDDTVESALEVAEALQDLHAQVELFPVNEHSIGSIGSIRADCIFNLIEWSGLDLPLGVDAIIQLEHTGIPFTGSGSLHYAQTTDKYQQKKLLDSIMAPIPPWMYVETGNESWEKQLPYPAIVKLAREHCSIGLNDESVVKNSLEARRAAKNIIRLFGQPVIVEEFIQGREFQVTLLDTHQGLQVLPPAEIVFLPGSKHTFLTYQSRWDEKHPDYNESTVKVADLFPSLLTTITRVCTSVFRSLHYCDYARFDIRMRGTSVYILEANSNPGLGESDEYGMTLSWRACGMTFSDVVWEIVNSCIRRFQTYRKAKKSSL